MIKGLTKKLLFAGIGAVAVLSAAAPASAQYTVYYWWDYPDGWQAGYAVYCDNGFGPIAVGGFPNPNLPSSQVYSGPDPWFCSGT